MQFTIPVSALLKPLDAVVHVIDRASSVQITSNVLLKVHNNQLSVTATNLQVEMTCRHKLTVDLEDFQTTLPGNKIHEICTRLKEDAMLDCQLQDGNFTIRSGKFSGSLNPTQSENFPLMGDAVGETTMGFQMESGALHNLLDKCSYAMAQQDVRYFLNGLRLEVEQDRVSAIATDGHRLALANTDESPKVARPGKCTIPRRGVLELLRALGKVNIGVDITTNANNLRAYMGNLDFQCKLIEGDYPNYKAAIPTNAENHMKVDVKKLIDSIERILIFSNEKPRGVRLGFDVGNLTLQSNNTQGEKGNDEVAADFKGAATHVGFNADYLLAALRKITTPNVAISFANSGESCRFEEEDSADSLAVIMPMNI